MVHARAPAISRASSVRALRSWSAFSGSVCRVFLARAKPHWANHASIVVVWATSCHDLGGSGLFFFFFVGEGASKVARRCVVASHEMLQICNVMIITCF